MSDERYITVLESIAGSCKEVKEMRSGNAPEMSWDEWMEKNKEEIYRIAHANTKHDKDGHVVLSRCDPWMQETCWDEMFDDMKRSMDK